MELITQILKYVIISIKFSLKMNTRASMRSEFYDGETIITQETSYKLKENIINVSLPACNIFRMRNNKLVKSR